MILLYLATPKDNTAGRLSDTYDDTYLLGHSRREKKHRIPYQWQRTNPCNSITILELVTYDLSIMKLVGHNDFHIENQP